MLGLRCRFSTLDLRSRFTTPTKLSHFVSLQCHFLEGAFHHPNDWGILLPSQNEDANKLTVYSILTLPLLLPPFQRSHLGRRLMTFLLFSVF